MEYAREMYPMVGKILRPHGSNLRLVLKAGTVADYYDVDSPMMFEVRSVEAVLKVFVLSCGRIGRLYPALGWRIDHPECWCQRNRGFRIKNLQFLDTETGAGEEPVMAYEHSWVRQVALGVATEEEVREDLTRALFHAALLKWPGAEDPHLFSTLRLKGVI